MALPVGLVSYLLVGWLRDSGRIDAFSNRKEFEVRLKEIKAERKKQKKKEENFAVKKWMGFGGGFYGTATLYTYAYIEVGEVFSFFAKIIALEHWFIPDLINLFVGFLINSIKNLVSALTWFQYWDLGHGPMTIGLAFLAAYVGYAVGVHFANQHATQGVGHVRLWRWWSEQGQGDSSS
ncbi:MAG: hypothetical protein HWE25_11495 [Alphaproteobacteria bacterium]|nr:hypothetical protein [Alphaproteobacteria bacterium]